ncbi:MAG: hemerythrin domain-containing protein [Deltaproteobacteria bacterium]|nr:hemerythrin domain-containing protein [Deltaproteobacteria bacterium]
MVVPFVRPLVYAEATHPVDLFHGFHVRVRRFVRVAARLTNAVALPAPEIREMAHAAERSFWIGVPLHAEDEDRSMTPRLRLSSSGPEVLDAIDRIAEEHPAVDRVSEDLAHVLRLVADAPRLLRSLRGELSDRVREAETLLLDHLALEERVIFPALRTALADAENATLLAECRSRGGGMSMLVDPAPARPHSAPRRAALRWETVRSLRSVD